MPWIIALTFGILLGIASGLEGFVVGFLIGLAGGFILRWKLLPKKIKANSTKRRSRSPIHRMANKRKWNQPGKLQWNPKATFVDVADLQLSEGMVYTVDSKHQRGIYLNWLAQGRRDGDPATRETGYVFCFFYGLERRLLVDKDSSAEILHEIKELLQHYRGNSRSIENYFLDLLHYQGYEQGQQAYRQLWPEYLQFSKHLDGEALKLVLANLYSLGERLHWTVALRLAPKLEGARHSVVIERSGEKFWKLFEQRFEKTFPGGMPLKVSKHSTWSEYRPSSEALLRMTYDQRTNPFRIQVPHVMGIKSQFKKVIGIWNQCIEDLSGYSRLMANHSGIADEQALKAFLKLPQDLRKPEEHPYFAAWSQLMADCEKEGEFAYLPVAAATELFGVPYKEKLTLVQSRKLAENVEGIGYQIAPDPRITSLPLAWNQECVVYRSEKSHKTPSRNLVGIIRMLFLTIAVADADGSVDQEEIAVFEGLAKSEIECDNERLFLEATGAALLRDTTVAVKSLTRIAGSVAKRRRPLIARYIIQVAAVDGVITADEHRMLKKAFRKFELPSDYLERQLAGEEDFGEVTVVTGKKSSRQGEKIPARAAETEGTAPAFQLDMSKIASITAETDEIVQVLADIMDEEETEESAETEVAASEDPAEESSTAPDWMEELGKPYQQPLIQLIQLETFSEAQLEQVASAAHLLPADLVSKINLWADDELDDFLIEETDSGYTLYTDMLPENE